MTRARYHAYLASPKWAKRRGHIRQRSRGICERCHAAKMDVVHHLTYARLGHEWKSDLQALCNPCHAFIHGKSLRDPRNTFPWTWLHRAAGLGLAAYLFWKIA